jgi:hypothetical protein
MESFRFGKRAARSRSMLTARKNKPGAANIFYDFNLVSRKLEAFMCKHFGLVSLSHCREPS